MRVWTWLIVIAVGLALGAQPIIIAALSRRIGLTEAAFLASLVCTVLLLLPALFSGNLAALLRHGREIPGRELLGGVAGAVIVLGMVVVVRRLGAGTGLAVTVALQMVTAMLADHYGLMGLSPVPVSLPKVAGVALLIAGTWLMKA